MSKAFGEKLKELRQIKRLSQKEFGLIFNASDGTISRWEKGDFEPDFEMLQKLADYFNVTTDYLLGRDSDSTITIRTAARGKGVEEREVNKEEYLAKLKKLEESREKDLAEIEELRKKLNGK